MKWLGVAPKTLPAVLILRSVVHGTALLFITETLPKYAEIELQSVLQAAPRVLVLNQAESSVKRVRN